jgi:serine/threonine-protein kinase/endoribonuclease IRE1
MFLVFDRSKREIVIVTDLDGKVYLVDTGLRKVLWSFESGRPIYSSYQEFLSRDNDISNASESDNDAYIDCGEDWALYAHSKRLGKVVRKLVFAYDYFL